MHQNLELFKQYKELAYKIANKFSKTKPWIKDEIESAALYGLWEAVKKEAEENPVSFYSVIIKNQILYQTRRLDSFIKYAPKNNTPSINYYDFYDESFMGVLDYNSEKSIEDLLIEKEDNLIMESSLEEAILSLSKDHQYLIRAMLGGKSINQICAERGCSKQNISKTKNKVISYLNEKLN